MTRPAFIILAAVAIVSTVGACRAAEDREAPPEKSAQPALATPVPPRSAVEGNDARLRTAFEAVFRRGNGLLRVSDEVTYRFAPGELVESVDGEFLLTPGSDINVSPVSTGTLGVFLLQDASDVLAVTGRWPDAIGGSIMGDPPRWSVSRDFGPRPVVVATSGGVWQGVACETTQLVELTAAGPVALVAFRSLVDQTGASRGAGAAALDAVQTEGTIENITPRQGFDVVFRGTPAFVDHYVWDGTTYVRRPGGASARPLEC